MHDQNEGTCPLDEQEKKKKCWRRIREGEREIDEDRCRNLIKTNALDDVSFIFKSTLSQSKKADVDFVDVRLTPVEQNGVTYAR